MWRRCALISAFAYSTASPEGYAEVAERGDEWRAVAAEMSDWRRESCGRTDMQLVTAWSARDKTVFAAFRGTDSMRDVLVDALVLKRAMPMLDGAPNAVRVHAGFLKQFRAATGAVDAYLKQHPEAENIVLTGHSLGGAVALLTAARFAALVQRKSRRGARQNSVACVTFGCPRVGNGAFAAHVDGILAHDRIVLGRDPVPDVPTRMRWKHAGTRAWYVKGGERPERQEGCPGDPWHRCFTPPNLLRLRDHSMAEYVEAVCEDSGAAKKAGATHALGEAAYTCAAVVLGVFLTMFFV